MGSFLGDVLSGFVTSVLNWVAAKIQKRNDDIAKQKAAQVAVALQEEQRTNAVLKAKQGVDDAVRADPSVLRRDPDQRDPNNDAT